MNRNRYTRKQRKSWATSACAAPEVVFPSLSQAASPLSPSIPSKKGAVFDSYEK